MGAKCNNNLKIFSPVTGEDNGAQCRYAMVIQLVILEDEIFASPVQMWEPCLLCLLAHGIQCQNSILHGQCCFGQFYPK